MLALVGCWYFASGSWLSRRTLQQKCHWRRWYFERFSGKITRKRDRQKTDNCWLWPIGIVASFEKIPDIAKHRKYWKFPKCCLWDERKIFCGLNKRFLGLAFLRSYHAGMDHSVLYKRNMSALTRANNKSTTDQLKVQLDFLLQFSGAGSSAVETTAFGHVVGFRKKFRRCCLPSLLIRKKKDQGRTKRPLTLIRKDGVGVVSSTRLSLEPVEKRQRG